MDWFIVLSLISVLILIACITYLLLHRTPHTETVHSATRMQAPIAPQFTQPIKPAPSSPLEPAPAQPVSHSIPVHLDTQRLRVAKLYINELRGQGYKDKEIKQLLKAAGWPAGYISHGMSDLNHGALN